MVLSQARYIMKKILIAEFESGKLYTDFLGNTLKRFGFELLVVRSTDQLEHKLKENSDIAAVCLDYRILSINPMLSVFTEDVCYKLRNVYKGPIVAIGYKPSIRKEQMNNGCSYQCRKNQLPEFFLKMQKSGMI